MPSSNILRCSAPRKKDRFRVCGRFVAAYPAGSEVLDGVLRHESHALPGHVVVACAGCGSLYAIRPPERVAA